MSQEEFYNWVYKNMGIKLDAYKQSQLVRRINNLMKRLNIDSLEEFIKLMESDNFYKEKFLDFITINVTEFFRNPNLYNQLEVSIRKNFINKTKKIKIWSTACSIGCEPYTLAMILKENNYKKFEIIATDIDSKVLEVARKGIYTKNEIKNIPDEYLKYFTNYDKEFHLSNQIKRLVVFQKKDLILDKYDSCFDLILCRNVVIYFNNDIKNEIYEKIYNSLNKGGLFFVGATESIINFKNIGYEKESTFIYKKN